MTTLNSDLKKGRFPDDSGQGAAEGACGVNTSLPRWNTCWTLAVSRKLPSLGPHG